MTDKANVLSTKQKSSFSPITWFLTLASAIWCGGVILWCYFIAIGVVHGTGYAYQKSSYFLQQEVSGLGNLGQTLWINRPTSLLQRYVANTEVTIKQVAHSPDVTHVKEQLSKALDIHGYANTSNPKESSKHTLLSTLWEQVKFYTLYLTDISLTVLEIIIVKLLEFLLVFPLLALMCLIGLADGFAVRAIRKAELGRESTLLFHKFSKATGKIFKFGIIGFIIFPFAVTPAFILVPIALSLGLSLRETSARVKKYV